MKNEDIIEFDSNVKKEFLKIFDKSIDKEGFIIDLATQERVLTKDGSEIELANFAGLKKGSERFIKSDINSVIELVEERD
ncbi:MAG: hypothetical protein U9Q69_04405 [Nanoarchaeota archaeon]|nr:hypothetical protein [Nanoarchaeota archaeon]